MRKNNRYSRHLLLEGFGEEGQRRLSNSSVLIIGAGGLGSPCAMYLAAAGVGTIGIADGDVVSLSNLQRQVIHYTNDVGRQKVASAAAKMAMLNPDVKVEAYDTFVTKDNIMQLIAPYHFILDCTDSFASKYLVNDACVLAGKPFCCGGVVKYSGQIMTHVPGSACYRCLFPSPPPENEVETCSTVGVLGPAVGVMGTIQAAEAVKYLAGVGRLLTNALLTFDTLTMQFMRLDVSRNPDCVLCGNHPVITDVDEYSFQPCRITK